MARSPRSGRCSCGTSSHLGPPTAPKRIAWAARGRSRAPGASGLPVRSIAAPPTSPRSNSNAVPVPLPTASSTPMASGVTSAPMPSPGRTAIRYVAITWPPRFSAAPRLRADFLHALGRRPSDPVQGAEVRARARLDDVRRGALARDHRAVEVDLHRDLADRVLARRGRAQRVVLEPSLEAGDGVDRRQHRVDRPVAHARILERLPFLLQAYRRRRHDPRAADDVEVVELVDHRRLGGLVGDDRHQVLVVDLLLPVGEVLERLEGPVELRAGQREAELLEPRREGGPAGVLAEDQLVRRPPDVLGPHDLVRELFLEDPVLMDAGLVGEGVLADDRLVRLDVHARDVGEQPGGLEDLLGPDARLDPEEVLPRPERHHDLLERRVARALADPVDGALHLPGPVHERGQRVRHRLTEVVVAVDGEHDLVEPLDFLADPGDTLASLARDHGSVGAG